MLLLRARVAGISQAAEIDDVIAAILISRFNGRSIQELCAMGGITLDDFTQSVTYREIFGRGEARGEAKVTLRLGRAARGRWRHRPNGPRRSAAAGGWAS